MVQLMASLCVPLDRNARLQPRAGRPDRSGHCARRRSRQARQRLRLRNDALSAQLDARRHGGQVTHRGSEAIFVVGAHQGVERGLYLRAAFRPTDEVCVVRAVARQRDVLLAEQASWVQRMQKALVQMNIQLTEVLSDVMGTTGQAIIRAIVAGERDPKVLARHRHIRVKASEQDIAKALTGMSEASDPKRRPMLRKQCDSFARRARGPTSTPMSEPGRAPKATEGALRAAADR